MKTSMRPYIILITGGIGSGKSIVSRICRMQGLSVYDCDKEAKRLIKTDECIKRSLALLLGEEILDSYGLIKAKEFSEALFSDQNLRDTVNSLVHQSVLEDVKGQIYSTDGIMLVEAAVASTGLGKLADRIWLVEAPEEVRIQRVMDRNSLCKEDILKRIEAQRSEWQMLDGNKTEIIKNYGDNSLILQIYKLLEKAHKACSLNMNNN